MTKTYGEEKNSKVSFNFLGVLLTESCSITYRLLSQSLKTSFLKLLRKKILLKVLCSTRNRSKICRALLLILSSDKINEVTKDLCESFVQTEC